MFKLLKLLCLSTLFLLPGCDGKKDTKETVVRSVKTMTVSKASITGTRQISGVLKPSDESDLSFQVGGTVRVVEAKLGDTVKKDDLLASLDPRDYELKLQSAQAALASAKADVATTSEDFKRQESLLAQQFASKATFEKARSVFEAAQSKEKIAISKVEEAERDLERTKLLAPFDGKISLRSIEPHQETQSGRVVFKLQSKEGLKAEVLVPESLIRGIVVKQPVNIQFPTLKNLELPGIVREIGAQSTTANAFPVTIDLVKLKPDLRAGMSAVVLFSEGTTSTTPIYLIPLTAIDTKPQSTQNPIDQPSSEEKILSVFLFDKDTSTVKKHNVTVKDIHGNMIEVVKGLNEGDIVITAGVPFLENGEKVTQWTQKYRNPETDK